MQKFTGVAQDTAGNAVGSVTITVNLASTGTLATLFSDDAYTAKANPFVGNADGTFQFYAGDGRYDVVLTKTGFSFPAAASSDTLLDNRQSIISPAPLAANQNDYSPANALNASIWRLTSSASVNITGIGAGKAGQYLTIVNVGSNLITFNNESASSAAANRLVLLSSTDIAVGLNSAITLVYDTVTVRWRDTRVASAGSTLTQTFRGLTVRTNPDSDIAAKSVMLVHADEIVLHDGTKVADWDRITADISAAGAGGLDTGAEAASTWYEAHAIRKSSDGTKNLMLHRAKDNFLDETFLSNDANRRLRVLTATATDKIAQGIKVDTTGLCPYVDVKVVRTGAVSGNVWFTLEADSAGDPSGTALATSDKMDATVMNTALQTIRFVFRNPTSLTATTQYHLVFQGDYARSDTITIDWGGLVAGGYANGASREFNGTVWSATAGASGLDRNFVIYITRNDTAVTMPSGYDQRCLIGWVFNNSGSNFDAIRFVNRKAQWGVKETSGSQGPISTPVLFDMSAMIPPIPVIVETGGASTAASDHLGVASVPDGYGTTTGLYGISFSTNVISINDTLLTRIQMVLLPVATETQALYLVCTTNAHAYFVLGWEW